jgi:hypothetical protein
LRSCPATALSYVESIPERRRSTTSVEALDLGRVPSPRSTGYGGSSTPATSRTMSQMHHGLPSTIRIPYGTRPRARYGSCEVQDNGTGQPNSPGQQTPRRGDENQARLRPPNTTLGVHLWRQRGASSRLEIRPTEHILQVSQVAPCFSIFTAVELSARPGLERTIRTVHDVEPHTLRSDRYLCIVYYQRRPRTRARSLHNAAAQRQQHQGKSDKCWSLRSWSGRLGPAPLSPAILAWPYIHGQLWEFGSQD